MKNSVIVNFIIFIFQSFGAWFEASILGKIGKKCGVMWKKIANKSFFANFLSNSSGKCTYRDSSLLFKILKSIALFFRRIFSKLSLAFEKSAIISALGWYYKNFFEISIAHYGVFLIAVAVSFFAIILAVGKISLLSLGLCALVAIAGFLAILINMSLSGLVSGSVISAMVGKVTTLDIPSNSKKIQLTFLSAAIFAVLGVGYACLCHIAGFLYATLAFVGLIGAGAAVYNFRLGVYIALVIFPFAPTMVIVAITLLSLVSFVLKYITDKDFTLVRTSLDVPVLVFMTVLFVSTLTSYAFASSIKIFMVYFVFVAGYFAITNAVRDFKTLMTILVLMLVASFGVSAYGIFQHTFGFAGGKTWTDTEMFTDIATRVVSTFENPNVLGEYLLLLIPVGVAMFISIKDKFAKTEHLIITAALGLCMIYTYSRGNWIGLIVAMGVFILFYDSRFVWLGIIAIFAAPFVLSESVISRFTSIGDTRDTSTSYRVFIWKGTLKMLKDYWLCGIGLGSDAFDVVYTNYAYESITAPHSHSLYLQLLTENGVLGFTSFIVLMVAYFKTVISKVVKQNKSLCKAIILALAAGVFGYLVQGFFDNVWYNYRVFYMFFAVLGLTMAAVKTSGKENEDD